MIIRSSIERPRLRPYFYAVPLANDRAQLRSAHRSVLVNGPGAASLLERVLPLLDGTRDVDAIAQDSGYARPVVEGALRLLDDKQLLEDARAESTAATVLSEDERREYRDQLILFSTMVTDSYGIQARLRDAHVIVIGFSDLMRSTAREMAAAGVGRLTIVPTQHPDARVHTDALARDLQRDNPRLRTDVVYRPPGAIDREFLKTVVANQDLVVVCNDGPSRTLCHAVNEFALGANAAWLPITVFGNDVSIGPLIVPGQTACFVCYEARMASNLVFSDEYIAFQEYLTRAQPGDIRQGGMKPYAPIAAGFAVVEAVKFITKVAYPTILGRLLRFNFTNYQLMVHPLLRLPRCLACGAAAPVSMEWEA